MVDSRTPHDAAVAARANASPFYKLLGMEVVALGGGTALVRVPVGERLHQLQGAVHGGVAAALADTCVGVALLTLVPLGHRAVTVEMKINFLAPVEEGELIGDGRIVHKGRRLALGEADILDQSGRLVAKALVTYTVVRPAEAASWGGKQEGRE